MVLHQRQGLLDDLIDLGDVLFGLSLVREFEQAVGDGFAAEGFVADDLQVLAEIIVHSFFFDVIDAGGQGFSASGNRRQRIIDLVHDAGCEPADRGELLCVDDRLVHLLLLGDVFADGDNVRHFGVIDAHRHFRDFPYAPLAFVPGLLLDLDDLAGAEDGGEFVFEHAARLARQHAEDVLTEHFVARDAAAAKLAVAVPGDDAHIAINDVKRHRQGIDDLFGEALLLFSFARALGDFDGEIDRGIFGAAIKLCVANGEAQLLRHRAEQSLIVGVDGA